MWGNISDLLWRMKEKVDVAFLLKTKITELEILKK